MINTSENPMQDFHCCRIRVNLDDFVHEREARQHRMEQIFKRYAAGIREFSAATLIAAHRENVNLRAEDLIEITAAELASRGLGRIP